MDNTNIPAPRDPLASPARFTAEVKRVAILFSGGPAPAANAVISTAAAAFLDQGVEVFGIKHGYSKLVGFKPEKPLVDGQDYLKLDRNVLKRARNSQGILLGTARANPGKLVFHEDHLKDEERTAPLRAIHAALRSLGVDALVSIGGDDTLTTANKFQRFQEFLPPGTPRIRVVHVPKTIDNDYKGIDFTFGYFTAVHTLAVEIRNLLYDAEANQAYFIAETMGRSAGWIAYGAAIASEASLVIGVEDIVGKYHGGEEAYTNPVTGMEAQRTVMHMDNIVQRIVKTIRVREAQKKPFGVIVLAEGLAEFLPGKHLEGIVPDEFGHIPISKVNLARILTKEIAKEYEKQSGDKKKKFTPLQLGYESRCAQPHSFDVILGSQLGVGAFRALAERNLDGVMISVSGQLELNFVPFSGLVDPQTLVTVVRHIERYSDFHQLARFLETRIDD